MRIIYLLHKLFMATNMIEEIHDESNNIGVTLRESGWRCEEFLNAKLKDYVINIGKFVKTRRILKNIKQQKRGKNYKYNKDIMLLIIFIISYTLRMRKDIFWITKARERYNKNLKTLLI